MKTIQLAFLLMLVSFGIHAQTVITYSYDKTGRLTGENYATAYSLTISYDAEGNLISRQVSDPVGIKDTQQKENGIKVYPNPVIDRLVIESLTNEEIGKVILSDTSGKVKCKTKGNGYVVNLDLSRIPGGIYLLKVGTGASVRSIKIVKQ